MLILLFCLQTPALAQSQNTANESLQQQIAQLLMQVEALQAQLQIKLQPSKLSRSNNQFTTHLRYGMKTEEVFRLQILLSTIPGVYPEGLITSFYGTLTTKAVERFQSKMNIVHSGTPETTGFGAVGPLTRLELNKLDTATDDEEDVVIIIGEDLEPIIDVDIIEDTEEGDIVLPIDITDEPEFTPEEISIDLLIIDPERGFLSEENDEWVPVMSLKLIAQYEDLILTDLFLQNSINQNDISESSPLSDHLIQYIGLFNEEGQLLEKKKLLLVRL